MRQAGLKPSDVEFHIPKDAEDFRRIQANKKAAADRAQAELDAKALEARRAQWLTLQQEFGDVQEPSRKRRLGVEEESVGKDPLVGPPPGMEEEDEATQPPTTGPGFGWGWY